MYLIVVTINYFPIISFDAIILFTSISRFDWQNLRHVLQKPGHNTLATQSCSHISGVRREHLRKWLSVHNVAVNPLMSTENIHQ